MNLHLLGFPLSHSVSPALHAAALAEAGLDGWTYVARAVPPAGLAAAVDDLRQPGLAGANVTVPHKQAIMPLLDGVTPVAQAIGAVNTVVKQPDGRLIGHNTDAAGFLADLYTLDVHVGGRPVLMLGAGGSARAVVAACAGVGARMRLMARRREQAEAFQITGAGRRSSIGRRWASCRPATTAALIVNCTPLGMSPKTDAVALAGRNALSAWPLLSTTSFTIRPRPSLCAQAQAAGLRAATGLGMLVEQGALAFELWTGHAASRTVTDAPGG